MDKTSFLTIYPSFENLAVVKETLPKVIGETLANDARLIVHDSSVRNRPEKWQYLQELNKNNDFFLLLSDNISMAHARNMCLQLGQSLYAPDYICMLEDDHGYLPGFIPSMIYTIQTYYGKISPNGFRYGLFTGCGRHYSCNFIMLEDGNSYPDANNEPMEIGRTNSCCRCAPTAHWNNVLLGYDTDEYLISTYQTKNLNYRNYHKGFTSMLLQNGKFVFDIEAIGRGTTSPGIKLWDQDYAASDRRSVYSDNCNIDDLRPEKGNILRLKIGNENFNKVLEVIRPHTVLNEQCLYSLYHLAIHACEHNIQGNFVEFNTVADGSSVLLAWVIKSYSMHPRRLFLFGPAAVDERIIALNTKLGVADIITMMPEPFMETLQLRRNWIGMVALIHLGGTLSELHYDILNNLYDRLVCNSVIQIDNYDNRNVCNNLLDTFEHEKKIHFSIKHNNDKVALFRKKGSYTLNPQLPKHLVEEFNADDPVAFGIESQMSANERFQLYYAIRYLLPKSSHIVRFIEIGSYSGASFFEVCKAMQRMGIAYQAIAIEPNGQPQFLEVIKGFRDNSVHLPLYSHEAAQQLAQRLDQSNKPEFILIDGDHSYEGVLQDIIDYYPLLAPGGIMMFHDYLPEIDDNNREFIYAHHANTEPGIRQACQEMMEGRHGLTPVVLPLLYPNDPTQTQVHLPIIPEVFSTMRAYIKPREKHDC